MTIPTRRYAAVLAAVVLAAGLMLAGCSSSSSSSASSSSASSAASSTASASASAESSSFASSAVSESANILKVGNQTATAKSLIFVNKTGQPVTNVALTPVGAEGEPVLLMAEGQQVAGDGMVQVFVEPTDAMLYNATIKCGDKVYTLHDLNLSLYEKADVALEGDVAYVRVNVNGSEVSSLREESAKAQQAAQAAAAQEQQQPAPEEQGGEQTEEVYYEESYDDTSYDTGSSSQTGDSCVSDVVLR